MDDFVLFNLYESVFWIITGITLYLAASRYFPVKYKQVFKITSLILLLFGISDIFEIKTQGFLYPTVWWLLVWKVTCVIGMILMVIWYLKLKLEK
jgi:hypothetical protein